MSGVASHGTWCGARTYPTSCRHCGSEVFYFTCNCGSKVFFDELGGDWPEHRCIEYLVTQYGKEFVERGLARQMMRPGLPRKYQFKDEYAASVEKARKAPSSFQVVRNDPRENDEIQATGTVREVILEIDLMKKFDLPDTLLGRAFLGLLGDERFGQLTVHVGSMGEADVHSFTMLASTGSISAMNLERGALLSFRISAFSIPGKKLVWLAEALEYPI